MIETLSHGRSTPASDPRLTSRVPGGLRLSIPFIVAAVVALSLIPFPRLPIGTGDDSSWTAVLAYAYQHGLQFGKDIAFTYGPLGFLLTPYLCPQAQWLRLITDLGLCAAVVGGVCLWAWRLTRVWRWALLCVVALLAANADPRSELLLYMGVLSWGLLCLEQGTQSLATLVLRLAVFSGLVVFASLAKVTFPFVAAFSVVLLSADLVLRGQARLGMLFPAAFAAALVLGWMAAGQNPLNFGRYLANAVSISQCYDQAMGNEDFPLFVWAAVALVLLTLLVLLIDAFWSFGQPEGKNSRVRRVIKFAWLSGLVFIVWKEGFVQVGRDHGELFLGFIPTLALALAALPGRSRLPKWLGAGAAVGCCLLAFVCSHWLVAATWRAWATRPLGLLADHAKVMRKPAQFLGGLKELQDAERAGAQLPKLRARIAGASVDVFGYNQAYAILNQLNFRPRPVFQSYAAYDEPLMRLNEQFYASRAPDFVLFRMTPIFDRFPSLEDAWVFRRLLLDYEPIDAEGPFVLLKAHEQVPAQMQLLREGTLRAGELLSMRDWLNSDVWITLEIEPSLLGSLRSFWYKPPQLELGVWMFEGEKLKMAKFAAPPAMLACGFLGNPLVLENQDVVDLYVGKRLARAAAYSLELPVGTKRFWRDTVRYKVYRFANPLGRNAAPEMTRLVEYPGFEATPEQVVSSGAHKMITAGGKPAMVLVGGGFLQFRVPGEAKVVKGNFGFAAAAYLLGGGTAGAEFRIEEQYPDGHVELLYSQVLKPVGNPDDRGMKAFEIACPGSGERRLFLRAVPLAAGNSTRDWTCWSEIGFK